VKRLVLVRHGESIWNAEGRIQGQLCAGLSANGHAQAAATGPALAAAYPDATLVTSDLQRTVETAAPLAEALERDPLPDPRLRERTFGAWEGRLRDEVIAAEGERWRRWLAGEDVVEEVGGESAEMLADRVEPVLRELFAATPPDGVTIAVTHGGPIWHGVHRLLDLPIGTLGGVDNTSVTELLGWHDVTSPKADLDDPDAANGDELRIVLDRWNEIAHLPVALRTGWRPRQGSDAPPVGR
jgi:glucosyl-3-phosphoglycerate phosphatase